MNNHTNNAQNAVEDCPTCYGVSASCGKLADCSFCEFADSCRWYIDNPDPEPNGERSSRGHHVSFEAVQFSEEVAEIPDRHTENLPEDREKSDEDKPKYSENDFKHLLEFFLVGVDDYSLAIVLCAMREDNHSAADLARAFDVSREAMHRKLLDTCQKHPEIGFMLRGVLQRCVCLSKPELRRTIAGRRTDQTENELNQNQMEFDF